MTGTTPGVMTGVIAGASEGDVGPGTRRRVWCCRSLRMEHVRMVGFDMDYTLAIYDQPEMDRLQTAATLQGLVALGYPDELADVVCPTDFAIRGLVVDLERGNVLKMDRYRYVKRAHHGLRALTRAERREQYESRHIRAGTERYSWVDTLYALADVTVYATVIDHLEARGAEVDYRQLFADVRASADAAHASGEVNRILESDFDRYLRRDPELGPTLHRLRSAGKRLFLLTNSRAAQTEPMMSYLLDGAVPGYRSWKQFFDVVVTGATKPTFFAGDRPFVDVASPELPVTELRRGRLYAGGNMSAFERLVGMSGTEILYVGDHIYGDVLRANVESGWRTLMIIQEMADELAAAGVQAADIGRLDALDAQLGVAYDAVRDAAPGSTARDRWSEQARLLEAERDALEDRIDAAFHPYWGSPFKAGVELSRFGAQVEQYAWLYAERVSDLGQYSPTHYFRSPRALMPHEL